MTADRHAPHVVNVQHTPPLPEGLELPQATGMT